MLYPNKAHRHDQSNQHLHVTDLWQINMQTVIFDIFPTKWKMANLVPIYKRDNKQNVKNYRPVSLLPFFGKTSYIQLIF